MVTFMKERGLDSPVATGEGNATIWGTYGYPSRNCGLHVVLPSGNSRVFLGRTPNGGSPSDSQGHAQPSVGDLSPGHSLQRPVTKLQTASPLCPRAASTKLP